MKSNALLGYPPKGCESMSLNKTWITSSGNIFQITIAGNKSQMFYGLLKDITLPLLDDDEEDAGAVDDDKPKVDFNF